MNKIIFTIVNGAYLAYAFSLRTSIKLNCPGYEFKIILLEDAIPEGVCSSDIILAKDCGINDFYHRAFYYNITEFATSIKPDVIRYFFSKNYEIVAYSDPDIYFYCNLDTILRESSEGDIYITPHILEPMSSLDGRRPNELDLLRTGTYNLGFICLRRTIESARFVEWWADRLKYFSFENYDSGMYTDQKWINLALDVFNRIIVVRNKGCNVAYWNLENRDVSFDVSENIWKIDQDPLIFFHFSGFKANRWSISKNQTRIEFKDRPGIEKLFYDYKILLDGYDLKPFDYSYDFLGDRNKISAIQRQVYFYTYISSFYQIDIIPFNMTWQQILANKDVYRSRAPISFHQSEQEKRLIKILHRFYPLSGFLLKKRLFIGTKMSNLIKNIHLITNLSNYARIISERKEL